MKVNTEEFKMLYKEAQARQCQLTAAYARIKELENKINIISLLRAEELKRLQKLVDEDSYISFGELKNIFGDSLRLPEEKVDDEHVSE